ncbi:hypothetical protein E5A73_05485 [Sphingomonas gei]|uniref:Porin n=1 Tax=Sphingomonas gei TaxID=1395960 RepID=A0A4S1XG49_9SPHN|nr:putative porin [Sphingomonas gei]TGX54897.1 hypothetical protein E5A73_05485 [Sphingomonas gei]
MSLRTHLLAGAALLAALGSPVQAHAQTTDDIGIELLQLLVDEGVLPREKADQLLAKARDAAALRAQREAPRTAATIDVPYVPETVRAQIRDEVKQEVVAQARSEGWIAPNTLPEWTQRISINGDFRIRSELQNFSKDNFPFFPDVGAINRARGVTNSGGFPLLNSLIDRRRLNYRARINVDANITKEVQVGFRLASGNEPGAVSTNATLGNFFQKDEFWLDRAYIAVTPLKGLTFTGGRIANPFLATDMVWDADINPEGVAATARHGFFDDKVAVFGTAAYFPLEERLLYSDSFMAGGQLGVEAKPADNLTFTVAGSYYNFQGIQSRKNAPDGSRLNDYTAPLFLEKGNSVFNVRTDGLTTLAGLASDFDLAIGHANLAYDHGDLRFGLTGEVVKNLALDRAEIARLRGEPGVPAGDLGWQVRFDAGYPIIRKLGDWHISAAYKRIETDAVVDIFADSDFGLGGTDVKGYAIEGAVGIYDNTSIGVNWLSTDAINRPPFSVDVLQINLVSRF